MKKLYLLLLSGLIIFTTNAQSYIETFIFCDRAFTIKCEPTYEKSIKTTIKENSSILVSYSTWSENTEIFAQNFLHHFLKVPDLTDECKNKKEEILVFGREFLKNYLKQIPSVATVAGILRVQNSVSLYKTGTVKGKWTPKRSFGKYKVLRLQTEIHNGYLENIIAYLDIDSHIFKFTLPYPAGITSEENFKKFKTKYLYQLESSPYEIKEKKTDSKKDGSEIEQYSILLGDLLDYNYALGQERRDYSPKDTAIDILGDFSLALHKEETKKILEAQIYSDFEGLNAEKPNGLVQAEITKRININTVQRLPLGFLYPLLGSWGAFQYIAPVASINKIEANNKYLVLSNLDMLRTAPGKTDISAFDSAYHRHANTLALYQHQWISAGVDLNLLYFNNHSLKYEIYLNIGGRFGLSAVCDSLTANNEKGKIATTGLVNNYSASTVQWYPEVRFNFLPEERVSFSISQKLVHFKTLSPVIQQITFKEDNPEVVHPKSSGRFGVSELLIGIRTNPNSRLFGRVRFNWEQGNAKNNFAQFQVGYSTYILGNK